MSKRPEKSRGKSNVDIAPTSDGKDVRPSRKGPTTQRRSSGSSETTPNGDTDLKEVSTPSETRTALGMASSEEELIQASERSSGSASESTLESVVSSSSSSEVSIKKKKPKDKKSKDKNVKGAKKKPKKSVSAQKDNKNGSRKLVTKKKVQDGNFGTIRVRMECVSMKTSFEILNNISPEKCSFRFTADGFYMAACNKPKEKQRKTDTKAHQKCEAEFYFPFPSLSYYKYALLDSYSNVIPYYDTCVCTRTFYDQIRNLKKGNLVFKLDANTTYGTDTGFYIVNGRLKNHVPSLEGKNKYPKMKKFAEYYTKATPRAKPINSELDSKMVSAKNAKCTEIEFKHFTRSKNTTMFGYNETSDVPPVTYPFENVDDNSSMEKDTPDDAFVMRTVRTENCEWIYKICKLSGSVLEIYIHDREDTPLGLRTSVGSQGTVTITVRAT